MIFYFLAVLASVTRAFGDFRAPIYQLITAVLLALLWRSFPDVPGWRSWINTLLRWSTWALVAGVIGVAQPLWAVLIVTACVWAFDLFRPIQMRGQSRPLILTGALYALWWTVFFQLPLGYRWLLKWSFSYTHFLTQTMSVRLWLGPSASAVDLLILGVAGILAFTIVSRPRRWLNAIVWIALLEAGRIVYIWLAPSLETLVGKAIPVSLTPHLDMPGVYFLFVACVLWLISRDTIPAPSPKPAGSPRWSLNEWRSPWVLGPAICIVLAFIVATAASYTDRPVRVLFVNKNTLDYGVPIHGRYGDRSGGMFGFLPKFLDEIGDVVYRSDITPGILDSVDVIFIANLLDKLPVDERQRVWDFVDQGGGLLIVGDHTGTEAIRDPTNDLLSPCGMELNFDTAVPLRRSWASAKSFLYHPAGRSGGVMDAELWLGASVTPGPKGEPFVIGRGAFSDPGDRNNKTRSYLGNLAYDPGEPLGDVVLACAAHWGKGRAILHGDTSPYQNGTMVRSHSLINRSVRWLAHRGWDDFIDRDRDWLLLILLGGAGTLFAVLGAGCPGLLAAALLLPAISVGVGSIVPGAPDHEWKPVPYRQAMIDEGHGSLFDGMSWELKSIGGVQYNLMRNGFSPRFAESPWDLSSDSAAIYIISTPTIPYGNDEVDRLEDYVKQGGWVLVNAGWNTYPAVRGLLDRFGLSVQDIPLGEADGKAFGGPVKMADAYPLAGDGEGIESLIEAFDYPVAKVARRGRGGLIAIADSQFLLNKNIEGQNDYVIMDNVRFFNELLQRTVGATVPEGPPPTRAMTP
ncbi:MAG: hypothetical protein HY304_03810 [candidate division Zixibacteria bacterium]|nr:hypothetical protein [candidate division Zixibacteria bacterium]